MDYYPIPIAYNIPFGGLICYPSTIPGPGSAAAGIACKLYEDQIYICHDNGEQVDFLMLLGI